MRNVKIVSISTQATDHTRILTARNDERPAPVKKIGKTTYRVIVHFGATSSETMSDKIKRMLRNEVKRM
ncbi:transposon-encoded TnpW family protein [Oscillibacter sp. GMB15532]|uniref:transposon-encoded TnpW family protein n=1 Tax=Oscillibacter sp. GMB15532 TaxID=3230022 RepID=UPI0034E022BD